MSLSCSLALEIEPWFEAEKEGKSFFEKYIPNCQDPNIWEDDEWEPLSTEDVELLRRFAIYNFDVLDDIEIGKCR